MEGDDPILLINASLHRYGSVKGRLQVTNPKMSHAQKLHRTKELPRQSLVRLLMIYPIGLGDLSSLKEHSEKHKKFHKLTYFS